VTCVLANGVDKRYLSSYFRNLDRILQVCGRILLLATKEIQYPLRDFVLVDYGGGSGLLSFLALEAGISTVIYNDIFMMFLVRMPESWVRLYTCLCHKLCVVM